MANNKILIVEDEILIASAIKKNIIQNGYECVGIAVDFDGAMQFLESKKIDLILLDVNISGDLDGIELGKIVNQKFGIPFIYISSYRDKMTLDEIVVTRPVAFISKPIDHLNLLTTLDIFFNKEKEENFHLNIGSSQYFLDLEKLKYVKADHVYLELWYEDEKEIIRTSLNNLVDLLPKGKLTRINRSIAVNPKYISKIERRKLYINDLQFSISPKYLENLKN